MALVKRKIRETEENLGKISYPLKKLEMVNRHKMYVKANKNKNDILDLKNMTAEIKHWLEELEDKSMKLPKTYKRKQGDEKYDQKRIRVKAQSRGSNI